MPVARKKSVSISRCLSRRSAISATSTARTSNSDEFPAEQLDRYPVLARELVESRVDVAITISPPGAVALKQITSTIPVVFVIVPDPIGFGLVASLAHPGGNLTGLSALTVDLSSKSLAPQGSRPNLSSVALFVDHQSQPRLAVAYATAAKSLGLSFRSVEISTPDDIERAFAQAEGDRVDGIAIAGPMLFNERVRVGASALAHKMPTITFIAEMVSYGL